MCGRAISLCLVALCSLSFVPEAVGSGSLLGGRWCGQREWITDYAKATSLAQKQRKMLLIVFDRPGEEELGTRFERQVVCHPVVRWRLRDYVCARLPADARITVGGEEVTLLEHAAFARMEGQPGIAILDFAHAKAEYYGCVVSAIALQEQGDLTARKLRVVLSLPPGTPDERARWYQSCIRTRRPGTGGGEPAEKAKPPEAMTPEAQTGLSWYTDYAKAMRAAETQGKMLFILFGTPGERASLDGVAPRALEDPEVRDRLAGCVRLHVTTDAEVRTEGKKRKLLDDPGLAEMLARPGIAMVDFAHPDAPQYGCVVSTFPVLGGEPYTRERLLVILDLPPGSLTQRTLIYAVRIHPERPQSTEGEVSPTLLDECMKHSRYQAQIRLQGHHQWDSRFQRILGKLPGGLTASEVCAESWPGEGLLAAAIECVRCWRLSSGHWSAVRARHPLYGYDMKRGGNGIWYATGIFATR